MLSVDKDGWITDKKIAKEQRSAIERSAMGKVSAIVLHRTASTNAASVLSAWKTKKEGTHFLISQDGKIYQTTSLKKQCCDHF
jgi:N-acetyl-anhydromuramyl-L-alanine amidase AmpD